MRLGHLTPDTDRGYPVRRGIGPDILVSTGVAAWLAAADGLLLAGQGDIPPAEFLLRPFGPLGLSPSAYVLLLLLAVGGAAGVVIGLLQRRWIRTPWPWRPALSALLGLNIASFVLGLVRLGSLEEWAVGRYFRGMAAAFLALAAAALAIPALARTRPDGSSARRAGRTAAALTLLLCLTILGAPLLSGLLLPRAPRRAQAGRPPSVLILMLDTVRADALSCLDPVTGRTPRIDAIAREGVLFRRAIAPAPWTVPSHASLFTGLFPSEHGVQWQNRILAKDLETLAEVFYTRGYRTAGFSENPNISAAAGFGQGLDDFSDLFLVPRRAVLPVMIDSVRDGVFGRPPGYEYAAESVSHLIRWLRGNALDDGPPFFAFVNLMAAHLPAYERREFDRDAPPRDVLARLAPLNELPQRFYLPDFAPRPGDMDVLRGLYAGDVAYLDSRLGRLFDFLRDKRLLDETILVIVSDHGENFGDHGLIEHAFCLYNSLVHVPLIIRYPAKVPAGVVRPEIVSIIRLADTVLDLAEIGPGRSLLGGAPEKAVFAECEDLGGMLRSVLAGEPGAERFDFTPFDKTLRCVYSGGFKLIRSSDGRAELYETSADWAESRDLAAARPNTVKRLQGLLDRWEAALVRPRPRPETPQVGRGAREALKALGYIH